MRILSFATLLFFALPAFAGNGGSGGGDKRDRDPGNAWFVGTQRTISACIEFAPGFGAKKEFLADPETKVKGVFNTWRDYMTRKLQGYAPRKPLATPSTELKFSACGPSTELTFYFGVNNPATEAAKLEYQDPMAYAHLISYDVKTLSGKGFIWVKSSPLWGRADNLNAILLHEVGHVLGNDHVPGTIMDQNILSSLWDHMQDFSPTDPYGPENDFSRRTLTEIDQRRELVICTSCPVSTDGVISQFTPGTWKATENEGWPTLSGTKEKIRTGQETFELFTGRKPVGFIRTHLELTPTVLGEIGPVTAKFLITDQQGSTEVPMKLALPITVDWSSLMQMYPKVFYVKTDAFQIFPKAELGGRPFDLNGTVQTKDGKTFPVVVQRNGTSGTPTRILYVDGDRAYELMFDRWVGEGEWPFAHVKFK